MKFNRLSQFQNNSVKLSRYRLALGILYELGIDQILLERGLLQGTVPVGVDLVVVNALANQHSTGWRECIEALFTLDQINIPAEEQIPPDYGAIEKMVADGRIRPEDAEEFLKDT